MHNLVVLLAISLPSQSSTSPTAAIQVAPASFVVRGAASQQDGEEFLRRAEVTRHRLCQQWLGSEAADASWNPPCELVLHGDRASLCRAIGPLGRSTAGSTLVRVNQGKVVLRRIDLLQDAAGKHFDTLAHELVHAIFAERFPQSVPPRWAEEGAALMADAHQKRQAHSSEFAQLHRAGRTFALRDLLAMPGYPPAHRFPEFYGQSLVLVELLASLGEPSDFVKFVERTMSADADTALREIYGLEGLAELESRWSVHAGRSAQRTLAAAQ